MAVSTTTTEATTTTAEATTTTVDPDAPPELLQTGDDYFAILQSLHDYIQWLAMHPDPALVANVAVPGSQQHQSLSRSMEALVQAGAAWDQPQETLSDFVLTSDQLASQGGVLVSAIGSTNRSARAIDASGVVVSTTEGGPGAARLVFALQQGDDGLWRLYETTLLSVVEQ